MPAIPTYLRYWKKNKISHNPPDKTLEMNSDLSAINGNNGKKNIVLTPPIELLGCYTQITHNL